MIFNVVPPLAFTSALSISVSLYYHADLQTFGERAVSFHKAIANVQSLPLPDTYKNQIIDLLQPVAKEIRSWLRDFHLFVQHMNLYQKLSWTHLGTIHYKRTAENCILSGSLTDVQAFVLACGSGNVGHVYRLWPMVKSRIHKEVPRSITGLNFGMEFRPQAYKFWMEYFNDQSPDSEFRIMNCDLNKDQEMKFKFRNAVVFNNIGMAEMFIQKLDPQLKKATISELVVQKFTVLWESCDINMFLFLMSHLDDESAMEIFRSIPLATLKYLLKMDLLQFFIPMMELLWDVFPFTDLCEMLEMIGRRESQSPQSRMYEDIFKAVWLKVPANEKVIFFDGKIVSFILKDLFRPYKTEYALSQLFKENGDALNKFRDKVISDVSAVRNILNEQNRHEVVKDLIQQKFAKEEIVDDFDRLYDMYTQVYTDEYNNMEFIYPDSDPDSELYIV